MQSRVLSYGETCVDKNAFHNNKSSTNINETEINRIV